MMFQKKVFFVTFGFPEKLFIPISLFLSDVDIQLTTKKLIEFDTPLNGLTFLASLKKANLFLTLFPRLRQQ